MCPGKIFVLGDPLLGWQARDYFSRCKWLMPVSERWLLAHSGGTILHVVRVTRNDVATAWMPAA